ncbi:Zn-dependent protease [Salinibacter ruber]|uniref:Peptidase, M50 family protein n=1 Tax=Salinibacter ruber (strain DSM 13855 / M31) TaxID=309807 RepID=Q2S409_SALRD|nr:site-2 protease family protein [Salinibacter ruber]ABC44881.1 peptidase, M50 family protein [Salinibacter ruber DSM 13855]MBB4067795.1 Zn-dependent protease [Salinibacter ruber]MCS3637100.1 Zn-dependent protease [Salinibacter ruber]MCS3670243.1 Zn-dependent protease [Salinibacter ruber]MCS3696033.1 Zn-dependent protease [Salinibacter ruber]
MEPNQSSGDARIEVNSDPDSASAAGAPQPTADRYWLHLLLFVLTLASTVYVGASWWANRLLHYEAHDQTISLFFLTLNQAWLVDGLRYAIPLVGFLTVHEFGHYFAARYHDVRTSLPYYIPFPFNGIGNFGAVISIRQRIPSTRSLFDIGVAGPLAGFVVALGALIYGFATLPPPEYLLDLPGHEALKAHIRQHGTFPDVRPTSGNGMPVLIVGYTPLYWALSQVFANVPPMYEMYHYPVLFAGWLGLFFTALNLLPVGQLDGGHVLYALLGDAWHRRFAQAFVFVLLFSGGIGFMDGMQQSLQDVSPWLGRASWLILAAIYYGYLYKIFGGTDRRTWAGLVGLLSGVGAAMALGWTGLGWTGWLVWSLLIIFLVRVKHPPVLRPQRLTPGRRILGYLAIAIFILCFSLQPLSTV